MAERGITIAPAPERARFSLRMSTPDAAFEAAFGCALPVRPCRSDISGQRAALWLGPDEWLLLVEDAPAQALHASLALSPDIGALVDVSERQLGFVLDGAQIEAALSHVIPLDLHLSAFPIGMVTRTLFEKAEIILWRRSETRFEIEIWRSFAPYLLALLAQVRRDIAADT